MVAERSGRPAEALRTTGQPANLGTASYTLRIVYWHLAKYVEAENFPPEPLSFLRPARLPKDFTPRGAPGAA